VNDQLSVPISRSISDNEVGLDAGVPVEGVDDHAVVVAVDGCAEDAFGDAADLAVEDDLHVVGAADVEIVGGEGFEERAGMPRGSEGDGLGLCCAKTLCRV
jgi:hypothetical protein